MAAWSISHWIPWSIKLGLLLYRIATISYKFIFKLQSAYVPVLRTSDSNKRWRDSQPTYNEIQHNASILEICGYMEDFRKKNSSGGLRDRIAPEPYWEFSQRGPKAKHQPGLWGRCYTGDWWYCNDVLWKKENNTLSSYSIINQSINQSTKSRFRRRKWDKNITRAPNRRIKT